MKSLILLLASGVVLAADYPPIPELFTLSWTGQPLVWPSAAARSLYKASGKLNPANSIATRAVIFRDDVYIAFPRYMPGVAVTLARASLLSPNHEPAFDPFPSWEAQQEGECSALQNVIDIYLDRKDVLWVLDSGVVQALDGPKSLCTPKVVGYELITGKQMYKVDLSFLTTNTSRLQNLVVDMDSKDRRFLYVSDAASRAILVLPLSADSADSGYRVRLPERVASGCAPSCPDVLYLALAKPKEGGKRLYFTYLCGGDVYSVKTENLQDATDHGELEYMGSKQGRMVIIGTDQRCTIYFRYEGKGDVYAWDVSNPLEPQNVHLVHQGDPFLLSTQAVLDPLRGKVRLLQSNVLDFLQKKVGVGAVHVLSSLGP